MKQESASASPVAGSGESFDAIVFQDNAGTRYIYCDSAIGAISGPGETDTVIARADLVAAEPDYTLAADRADAASIVNAPGVAEPVRVLLESDPYCPRCGHDRDKSSVSSVASADGSHSCQLCGSRWREVGATASPTPPSAAPARVGEHNGGDYDMRHKVAASAPAVVVPGLDESAEFVEAPTVLDEFHHHEALDRCDMLAQMVGTWLCDHPYVEQHSDVDALVVSALKNLSDAYQLIGKTKP